MTDLQLLEALRRLKVETGSLACFGCGYEHDCTMQGCRIIREATERIHRGCVYRPERAIPQPVDEDAGQRRWSAITNAEALFRDIDALADLLSDNEPGCPPKDGWKCHGPNCKDCWVIWLNHPKDGV